MQGFFYNRAASGEEALRLLARIHGMEVMRQRILKDSVVWLAPCPLRDDVEFFYVHSGSIEIELNGVPELFGPGDSFWSQDLRGELFFRALTNVDLLYISTAPVFDEQSDFQSELRLMLDQINKKDDYTYIHSRNVMNYSVRLYTALRRYCEIDSTDDIVVASLFHDIGKIRIPDTILKKHASLTDEEYTEMKRHSIYGAEILGQYYPQSLTNLVLNHHERLDGSGYPNGRKRDEISFGARILAVADSFDAMTTNRTYNTPKAFEAAATELDGMREKYDSRVTETLLRLVRNGELTVESGKK